MIKEVGIVVTLTSHMSYSKNIDKMHRLCNIPVDDQKNNE